MPLDFRRKLGDEVQAISTGLDARSNEDQNLCGWKPGKERNRTGGQGKSELSRQKHSKDPTQTSKHMAQNDSGM